MEYKTCGKCKRSFPATTEYFHIDKYGKYGLKSSCKTCKKEYDIQNRREYYVKNKEKICNRVRKYRKNNKDYINVYYRNRKVLKNQLLHDLTNKQWKQILKDFNNKCVEKRCF